MHAPKLFTLTDTCRANAIVAAVFVLLTAVLGCKAQHPRRSPIPARAGDDHVAPSFAANIADRAIDDADRAVDDAYRAVRVCFAVSEKEADEACARADDARNAVKPALKSAISATQLADGVGVDGATARLARLEQVVARAAKASADEFSDDAYIRK